MLKDLITEGALTCVLVYGLFAAIVQIPVWLASTVTVAVETPPDADELPTVHLLVVVELNVTAAPEVAEPVTVKVWSALDCPTFGNGEKEIVLG